MILLSCRSSLTRELSCPMAGVSSVNSLCDKFSSVKVCLVNIELKLKMYYDNTTICFTVAYFLVC